MLAEENNWVPAALFGGTLLILGIGMMIAHARTWKRQQQDEFNSQRDIQHLRNRYRRRMQTSAMLAIAGVLVALGDVFIWGFDPLVATIYWMMVILLVFWIALLALGDLSSVHSHSRYSMAELDSKRKALEAELAEYRRRTGSGSNGEPSDGSSGQVPDREFSRRSDND